MAESASQAGPPSALRPWQSIAVVLAGGLIGQMIGLVVFAIAANYKATGSVDMLNGVIGFGTLLFAPWSGIGAWLFGNAFTEQTRHSLRALVVACSFALIAVIVFFGFVSAFKIDGMAWMLVYALSPVLGALLGYRLGAFGFSRRLGRSET